MAKTLVIPNADYSANKLDKVSFDGIPCTGIELSESSFSLSDYVPVEIEYTVTPSDTTDVVLLTSSDTDVAIIENGCVKAVGLGTATITATCGEFSDTAVVSVDIAYTANYVGAAKSSINESYSPLVVVSSKWGKFFTACGYGDQQTTYQSVPSAEPPGYLNGIKLPKNTARVKISRSADKSGWFNNYESFVTFTKDEHSGNNTFPTSIKPISQETMYLRQTAEYIFPVPSGADSMFVSIEFSSAPADWDAEIATTGIKIEFLTAE